MSKYLQMFPQMRTLTYFLKFFLKAHNHNETFQGKYMNKSNKRHYTYYTHVHAHLHNTHTCILFRIFPLLFIAAKWVLVYKNTIINIIYILLGGVGSFLLTLLVIFHLQVKRTQNLKQNKIQKKKNARTHTHTHTKESAQKAISSRRCRAWINAFELFWLLWQSGYNKLCLQCKNGNFLSRFF